MYTMIWLIGYSARCLRQLARWRPQPQRQVGGYTPTEPLIWDTHVLRERSYRYWATQCLLGEPVYEFVPFLPHYISLFDRLLLFLSLLKYGLCILTVYCVYSCVAIDLSILSVVIDN